MGLSEQNKQPKFLDYIYELNEGRSLNEAFELSVTEINSIDLNQWKRIGLKTYAPGKWSIHTMIQHLIDWERIWCFRAILFARQEGTIPVAHDQELMAHNSNANNLPLEQLVKELKVQRQSSIMMFQSFSDGILDTNCKFFEYEMPLSAIGFSITAHQIHHLKIFKERYLPLIT